MAEESSATKRTKKTHRSPSYPAIDLETALQRARVLLDKEGRTSAPLAAVAQHWSYTPKSSAVLLTVAALKKYGLVEESGSGPTREFRLSQLALKILMDERPDSTERVNAIREAALKPAIHSELWQKYEGSIPSDATLRHYLRLDRKFAESAVGEFIAEFRRTIDFAGLTESDTLSESESDIQTQRSEAMTAPIPIAGGRQQQGAQTMRGVQLPLSATKWATLQAPFPLSEAAWKQMMDVLNAMKPALTESGKRQPDEEEG
jgi:hypothetical protein